MGLFVRRMSTLFPEAGMREESRLQNRSPAIAQDAGADFTWAISLERHLAGRHFIKHRSEREKITTRI